jgi:hypothetical protein
MPEHRRYTCVGDDVVSVAWSEPAARAVHLLVVVHVHARHLTDRQTGRQTDRQTDRHVGTVITTIVITVMTLLMFLERWQIPGKRCHPSPAWPTDGLPCWRAGRRVDRHVISLPPSRTGTHQRVAGYGHSLHRGLPRAAFSSLPRGSAADRWPQRHCP